MRLFHVPGETFLHASSAWRTGSSSAGPKRAPQFRGRRARALLVACFAVCVPALGGADVCAAGSLQLDAPTGARVSVDGRNVGVAPLPVPLALDPGPHVVRLDHPGAHTVQAQLDIGPTDELVHLTMRMAAKSRVNATARSMLLAGLGQHYVGRHRLGWALTAVEVGALAAAGVGQLQFHASEDDFNEAVVRYRNALDPEDIAAARADADAAYDDMTSAESLRNAALVTAAAAVVTSMLDAWFRFPRLEAGPGGAPAAEGHARATGRRAAGATGSWREGANGFDLGFHLALRAQF